MAQAPSKPEHVIFDRPGLDEPFREPRPGDSRKQTVDRLRVLWNGRRFLVKAAAIGFVLSVGLALLLPTRYQSTARLMPPDTSSEGAGMEMLAALSGESRGLSGLAGNLLGLKSSSDLFIGILGSQTAEDYIIHQFGLMKIYHVRHLEDARKELSDKTDLSADNKSGIITITVTDSSPERAAGIASAYVSELNRLVTVLSTSAAHRERIFLDQRIAEVKKNLESAEKQFSQFSSKNTAIDIKAQGRAMVDAAAALQGQLIAAETEMQALKQVYTNNNVRVRSQQARIEELQQQLKKMGGANVQPDSSGENSNDLYPSIRQLPLLGVPYSDLYRRVKVEETVFALLTQQDELAKIQEAKEIPSVKVLDEPQPPDKKSFPPRTAIVVLGTFFAFLIGVGWLLGRKHWNELEQDDPAKLLALEVYSSLRASSLKFHRNGNSLPEFIEKRKSRRQEKRNGKS